jgi:hypothetical protein
MKNEMKASKGAPPSRRTGKGGYMLMKKKEIMAMPKMRKMEPIKKIDYEADFDKAWDESMPNLKKSRKQMSEGKPNFKDIRQEKADRAVLTKGMKK